MAVTIIISVISFIVIILLIYLFIKTRDEVSQLRNKYSSIIDIGRERDKISNEIDQLKSQKKEFLDEFTSKKEKLTSDYDNAYKVFEKLQKEINLLEESLEMMDFGIYKPHFDFETSDEYRRQLELLREQEKEMIKQDNAVKCNIEWTVNESRVEGKRMIRLNHKLMLRAFNGECDAALAKVRWDNILKMEERIKRAFVVINKSGEVNKSYITINYLELKQKELRLTYEYQEKIKEEKDEQRRIQEEMREEEKAIREIERAKEEAEKEEIRYQKALEKAREDILKAEGNKVNELNEKILQLESKLKDAQELKERAISRAQITKSGHIYIISNIGSFGENIIKIGMTRRLEPFDRVRELGDASVPFTFDVHAMVYSDNAPELENKLHERFESKRINLVNRRREFFAVSLNDIEEWAKNEKLELRLTKIAEAREFRESQVIRMKGEEAVKTAIKQEIPESIGGLFTKDED